MLLPNKIISFQNSILSKLPPVLNLVRQEGKSSLELFEEAKPYVRDIAEYIEVLDCLYALGKIEYNNKTRTIDYVG
jgi:hypothetical protein